MIATLLRRFGLMLLLATSVLLVAPTAAQAAPAVAEVVQAAPQTCPTPREFPDGRYICAYGTHNYVLPNGNRQIWIIGTDWSMWTRWKRPSGQMSVWVNQKGSIRRDLRSTDFKLSICGRTDEPIMRMVGTDDEWYYNARLSAGTWTGWKKGVDVIC